MLKIYGIKNCSSMKKAFDLLTELGIAYDFHDYKKQGIDAETVKTWLDQVGQDIILNKKGTTWKKLTEAEQQHALSSETNLGMEWGDAHQLASKHQKHIAAIGADSSPGGMNCVARRQQKAPRNGGAFCGGARTRQSGSNGLDLGGQAALMTRGLVLVHDVLVSDTVDHSNGRLEHFLCGGFVASQHCFQHFFDGGAILGTQASVMLAGHFGLASALASLCAICHGCLLGRIL